MLDPAEWQMLQEAAQHRARVWRDQSYSARTGPQKIDCETAAHRLEEIARRIATRLELESDAQDLGEIESGLEQRGSLAG